jgi:hypothetical protein
LGRAVLAPHYFGQGVSVLTLNVNYPGFVTIIEDMTRSRLLGGLRSAVDAVAHAMDIVFGPHPPFVEGLFLR